LIYLLQILEAIHYLTAVRGIFFLEVNESVETNHAVLKIVSAM
jgi:hypothetical protein